jgi:hypothetical protein
MVLAIARPIANHPISHNVNIYVLHSSKYPNNVHSKECGSIFFLIYPNGLNMNWITKKLKI